MIPAGHADYLALVDYAEVASRLWYRRGIARLRQIAAEGRTAVMCSEEDPHRCHRHHLIAQTLLGHGLAVWHIRADGRAEAATVREDEPEPVQQLSLLS